MQNAPAQPAPASEKAARNEKRRARVARQFVNHAWVKESDRAASSVGKAARVAKAEEQVAGPAAFVTEEQRRAARAAWLALAPRLALEPGGDGALQLSAGVRSIT